MGRQTVENNGDRVSVVEHCKAVTRCEVAHRILITPVSLLSAQELQCAPIVTSQFLHAPAVAADFDAETAAGRWQIPEPWNGHLSSAPILFIGQNPSVDFDEEYPRAADLREGGTDEEILRTFEGRFDHAIADGTRPRRIDQQESKSNHFLANLTRLAARLYGVPVNAIKPGEHYALTEAVRCKSRNAIGLDLALTACARKFLGDTLGLSGAKVIVCLGRPAQRAFCVATGTVLPEGNLVEQRGVAHMWGDRCVLFLTHSNFRGGRALEDVLPGELVAKIQRNLSGRSHGLRTSKIGVVRRGKVAGK